MLFDVKGMLLSGELVVYGGIGWIDGFRKDLYAFVELTTDLKDVKDSIRSVIFIAEGFWNFENDPMGEFVFGDEGWIGAFFVGFCWNGQ